MEAVFHVSHKFNDPLIHACSSKNETAIAIAGMEIEKQDEKENLDDFIPSEEDSVSSHRNDSFHFYLIFNFWIQSIHSSHF